MTKEIQSAVAKYLILRGNEAVCENYGHAFFEMDIASISKSGMLHEYEVKISRSDLIADKKKGANNGITKFDKYAAAKNDGFGCPNYFYYVCPDKMISPAEIPIFAGLYYFKDGEISMVKNCKRIHGVPANREKIVSKMLRMTAQRKYLGGTMLTHKNRLITERNEKIMQTDFAKQLNQPTP